RLKFELQTLGERRHLAASCIGVQRAKIAVQYVLHLVDGSRRLGTEQLNERVLCRGAAGAGHSRPAVVEKSLEHALERAESRRGDAAYEYLTERQTIEAGTVDRLPRPLEQEIVQHALRAMVRHRHVFNNDVPASGRLQAADLPGIDAFVVGPRHEKDAPFGRSTIIPGYHGAEQGPLAMLAAACIFPPPAEAIATRRRDGPSCGHERRADQHAVIAAPYFPRRPLVQQRHEPGMHAGDAVDPAR